MTEKIIFIILLGSTCKLFLPLNILDFFFFVCVKIANPSPEESYPLFPINPPLKLRSCQAPFFSYIKQAGN